MRIGIFGWSGHDNVGDESYRDTLPRVLGPSEYHFTDRISGLTGCDAVVMGGGDIVYRDAVRSLVSLKARKFLASVSLTSCDCLDLLGGFDGIWVRDRKSFEKLAAVNLPGRLLPDAAFALEPDAGRGRRLWQMLFVREHRELYQRRVVVVVNGHLLPRLEVPFRDMIVFEKFCNDLAHVADNTSASFLFVPFGTSGPYDDRSSNAVCHSRCKFWSKNLVVYDRLPYRDVLDITAAADAAVCTRLHAEIFSVVSGTPFFDVNHHAKTADFLETFGLSDLSFNYWSFDRERLESRLDEVLQRPLAVRDRLSKIAREARGSLGQLSWSMT